MITLCCFSQQHRSHIVKKTTHVQLSDNGLIRVDSIVIQVNERMGDHDAQDYIIYQKGERASFGDIWIEDMFGNKIRKLKKDEIKERHYINGFSLFEDRLMKYFEAKHNTYPYRLVYTKTQESKKYVNVAYEDYSDYKIPIKEGQLILEYPVDKQIKQQIKNIETTEVDTIGNKVVQRYKYSHQPDSHRQIFSSVNETKAPQIIIAPLEFKYGVKGLNENWKTLGEWDLELNKGRDKLPSEEIEKINRLTSGLQSAYEKVKVLYDYLQNNTRYVNVSTKIGGLQTYPAEYVAANKYGDCKALSNYMQSMLKQVGVEAYYTSILSGDEIYDLDDDFSYNAFNHVILTVPVGGDTLFLECTSKNIPVGYMGTGTQGRKALMSKENASQLVFVPQLKPEDVLCIREFDLKIAGDGEADLSLNARIRGEEYEVLNAYDEMASRNSIDKFIRQNILDGSFEIKDYKITKPNKDSAYIDLKIRSKLSNVAKKYGNNLALNSFAFQLPTLESPEKRTQSLQIDYPIYKKDKLIIHLNEYSVSKMPKDVELESPYGDIYKLKFKKDGDSVVIEKELLITDKRLNLEEYNDFYSFLTAAKNIEIANYYFEIL